MQDLLGNDLHIGDIVAVVKQRNIRSAKRTFSQSALVITFIKEFTPKFVVTAAGRVAPHKIARVIVPHSFSFNSDSLGTRRF